MTFALRRFSQEVPALLALIQGPHYRILTFASLFFLLSTQSLALEFNMPVGVTDVSRETYWLHMVIFYVCVAIGVVVFGAMFYAMIFHRKSRGYKPASFSHNTKLELFWTAISALLLAGIAWPATGTLIKLYDTGGEDLIIEVRGYQWKWQYKYLDESRDVQLSFFSNLATSRDEIQGRTSKGEHYLLEVDEPLVIPVGKKVRFLVTSNDVIHAFWVPDFSIKRDAVPGFVNDLWTRVEEPGIYRGQCTELCGKDHGFMPIVVHVMAQEEYDSWYANKLEEQRQIRELTEKTWTAEELYARGEGVYLTYCASCHLPNGQGVPPVFPALRGSEMMLSDRDWHINIVYNGKAGTAMQAFREQLSPVDMAAVIHYERHAWGNNAQDVTIPTDILEFARANQ